ncbi:MarR family winged helix-turn-helix transcriptional regulator [Niallia oryzisoli]|uniref:MarR family winged helix-turn-helix transcriptional regulator n=1 Tax=Niallia oryzisoli TaxID=1737571 RepID=UPI003736CCC2
MFELNDSLSFLLSKCNQKAFALAQERLSEFTLTPEQAVALTYLFKKDGINQLQLGEMIQKDRTTISGIVNKLENLGYVRKGINPSDKRSSLIYVTEKAFAIKDAMLEQAVEVNGFLSKDLTDQEKEFLVATLKKLRNSN